MIKKIRRLISSLSFFCKLNDGFQKRLSVFNEQSACFLEDVRSGCIRQNDLAIALAWEASISLWFKEFAEEIEKENDALKLQLEQLIEERRVFFRCTFGLELPFGNRSFLISSFLLLLFFPHQHNLEKISRGIMSCFYVGSRPSEFSASSSIPVNNCSVAPSLGKEEPNFNLLVPFSKNSYALKFCKKIFATRAREFIQKDFSLSRSISRSEDLSIFHESLFDEASSDLKDINLKLPETKNFLEAIEDIRPPSFASFFNANDVQNFIELASKNVSNIKKLCCSIADTKGVGESPVSFISFNEILGAKYSCSNDGSELTLNDFFYMYGIICMIPIRRWHFLIQQFSAISFLHFSLSHTIKTLDIVIALWNGALEKANFKFNSNSAYLDESEKRNRENILAISKKIASIEDEILNLYLRLNFLIVEASKFSVGTSKYEKLLATIVRINSKISSLKSEIDYFRFELLREIREKYTLRKKRISLKYIRNFIGFATKEIGELEKARAEKFEKFQKLSDELKDLDLEIKLGEKEAETRIKYLESNFTQLSEAFEKKVSIINASIPKEEVEEFFSFLKTPDGQQIL